MNNAKRFASINLLFVCSMNRWRSPTAEAIYARHDSVHARSRGVSQKAARTVGAADLKWADLILVMENKHKQRLLAQFPGELKFSTIHVLDIPDDYQYMDPELVQLLQESVDPLIEAELTRGEEH